MNTSVLFSAFVLGVLAFGNDGEKQTPQSMEEGRKWTGRPAWIDAEHARSLIQRGNGTLSSEDATKAEPTPRDILERVYAQQIDVNPEINLVSGLEEICPERTDELQRVFRKRLRAREHDEELWQPLVNKTTRGKTIAQLEKRERDRTIELCDSLRMFMSADQQTDLFQALIKKCGYRSLTFPIVQDAFDVSDVQYRHLLRTYQEFKEEYAKLFAKTGHGNAKALGIEKYMKALRCLSDEQLEKYFHLEGSLAGEESLEELPDKFSGTMKLGVQQLVAAARKRSE